jgi:hypothetical protein
VPSATSPSWSARLSRRFPPSSSRVVLNLS